MGTTVTTNLALIKPDINESIKANMPTFAGWAAQNEDNMDMVDSLFRDDTFTYSPAFTAGGVAVVLGAGNTKEGKFFRLFPSLVCVYFRINMGGAGFAAGAGTYNISLPTGIASEFPSFFEGVPLGKAILIDNDSVPNSTVMTVNFEIATGNTVQMRSPTGLFNPTTPFTLAQNDALSGYFVYPTSDA